MGVYNIRDAMEQLIIKHAVQNESYFYLGQVISDIAQGAIVITKAPTFLAKMASSLGKLASLDWAAAKAVGVAGGLRGLAINAGLSGTAVAAVEGVGDYAIAGVLIALMDATGSISDMNKLAKAIEKNQELKNGKGDSETRYSGDLQKVDNPDAAADALADRIGGESRVEFSNDPLGREFDVVSDMMLIMLLIQHR